MLKPAIDRIRRWSWENGLSRQARDELRRDHDSGLREDPGIDEVVRACGRWLCRAQDNSKSADGGVARHYSLLAGWAASYPETTGYIIPTMTRLSEELGDPEYLKRTRRMLDWLVSIQLPGGGFQGGTVDATRVVPVTFNTGQILIGLAEGCRAFGDKRYEESMHRAARWLRDSLDADGCWRKHPTPFAEAGEKAYETHVAWGLLEAERATPGCGYGEAGLRQVSWALTKQLPNGWIRDCCLDDPAAPLTHTLGYFLRGVLEAYRFSGEGSFLQAARLTADALMGAQRGDGALPGRLKGDWFPAVSWSCLTGNSQVAQCWIILKRFTGEEKYLDSAKRLNAFVRRTIRINGSEGLSGGVKGAYPVDGDYGKMQYLNWAAKFTIDANLAERECE